MSGIAYIEMACWDIIGKALGQPVWRLLGGKVRDRIKAYANGWYAAERTPSDFHRAAKTVIARGYRALKLDPFGPGAYELDHAERVRSVSLVEAVRDAVGPDVEIMIEMHGRFVPAEAVRLAVMLQEFMPSWLEEPIPPENIGALRKVADHVTVPIAAGERVHDRIEFQEFFATGAVDVIQPDIGHIGGILEARKLAATAETHYLLVAPHNVGGDVLTAANLHLAACTPNFKIQEYFKHFGADEVRAVVSGLPRLTDGYFELPAGPGLGVTLNAGFVDARPARCAHFDLFAEGWQFRGSPPRGPAPGIGGA
jgi:galactonate dehydratase